MIRIPIIIASHVQKIFNEANEVRFQFVRIHNLSKVANRHIEFDWLQFFTSNKFCFIEFYIEGFVIVRPLIVRRCLAIG